MGSSCSSSQSLKDNVSVKSEDYAMDQKPSSQHQRTATPPPVRPVSSSTSDKSYDTESCVSDKAGGGGGGGSRQAPRPALSTNVLDNDTALASGLSQLESAPAPADAKETPRKTKGVIPHLGHLPDLNKLSDVIRNLVMGNVVFVKPILKPRKICIYTCADLKDTIMERSALMEHVYPKLRLYCMEKGYELNIVDLHWGIPDEHLNDHSFKELCLGQLTTQARDSHIVTVVFLNETFGNALLPRVIEGPDFDQAISAMEHDTDRELFWKWYHWDENAQPPCYKLQPISTYIPNIKDSNSASLHQEAVQDWNNEVKKMMTLMRMVFNQEQKEKYLSTVMEQEIKQSVFMNQESAKHCLWICRKFTHFPSHNIPAQGKVYVAVEPESKKRLDILQSELKERLDEIRMLKFRVKWHNSGMNPEVPEHAQYVEDLCAQISPLLISIIDGVIEEDETKEELKSYLGIEKRLFHELMQQSLMCQFRYKNFQGRQELLTKIRRYLSNDSCVPLIMHGEVGCGKSSLIAKAMERCCEWLVDVPLVVRCGRGLSGWGWVYGRLSTLMSDPQNHETYPIIKELYDTAARAPVPCLLPLTVCFHEPFQDQNMKLGDGQVYFNALIRARHNPHYVITLSTERGEIAVWNVFTMSPVRTLTGITQPRKLKMIDDYRCLVLCGRELRIYNFDEGLFVMKLREVMNQKMPFFGLHDKDHVVALSRSRMYVNMMNLQNGDCVATFKVGEDRFLNSLMVSENGKICVCGDETQKPSALLVWDLELRKLMYDLRIPHHEFITRLAAITKEGHYVSCVCREVDEPAPNFIVVYDLQSGTLFKKWKPGVNIISIAISSAGGCVVVGLEDSKLMAYDLITGNPRWTLKGHTAPPNTIRLDNRGLQCLTFDSLGRDRSVRVWDIHTGNSLAVLTPDQAITACEISSDGKAVVMALEGRNEIVTFLLCHQTGVDERPTPKSYGNDTNRGKVFDLSQAGTWPMSGDAEENMLWS
ncbi:uncharacterized protein [Penaeus vannamei]|uniref:uncharacterized protein n=1 Tax=Penaeus vannamei TaxID=6689 RepID=UPI00387F84BE